MRPHLELFQGLNVEPLLQQLAAHPELWDEITVRQAYPGSAHADTQCIFVRGPLGFTPDLCCAVWVGNDDFSPMPDGFGGHLAAPIFRSFMSRALKILKCDGDFPNGTGVLGSKHGVTTSDNTRTVRICLDSGGLAGPNCPRTELRTFKAGQALPGPCQMHRGPAARSGGGSASSGGNEEVTVPICVESGGLAGPYCPQVTERTMPRSKVPGRCRIHTGRSEPAPSRPEHSPPATNTNG
jgi:membrane peptidoglycan carboxypeptidase